MTFLLDRTATIHATFPRREAPGHVTLPVSEFVLLGLHCHSHEIRPNRTIPIHRDGGAGRTQVRPTGSPRADVDATMTDFAAGTVTRLLNALEGGDRSALDELFPIVYGELREVAHLQRTRWHGENTINTTALVHELYLKLADQDRVLVGGRAHFYALAGRAMRQILSNYARAHRTQKRGGGSEPVSLREAAVVPEGDVTLSAEDALLLSRLEDALKRLERVDHRRCRVVECRFYGGMSIPDTATALNVSPTTVKRDWAVAQAWLHRELTGGG